MGILVRLLLNTIALLITAWIVPGIYVDTLPTALLAAIVIGVVNTFIKPVLIFLTLPLTIITLGLFLFIVNAIVLMLATWLVPGFTVDGWTSAILGAIVLSLTSTILSKIFGKKDEDKK